MSRALEHHVAFVNGVRIHYVRADPPDAGGVDAEAEGSGRDAEAVVLLHGWPQTWYMWRKVIPALAERYTVIAPDLRGFGESSKPLDGYDKRTVAEDLHQLVRKLGIARVFVVGHDLGGPTAYAWACAHPEEVRRLAILDVEITIDRETAAGYFKRLFHLSFHAEPDIAVALVSGRERTYLTHFYRSGYDPSAFTHADIDEYVAAFSAPGAMRASMAHYGALWTDLEHNIENAKTPLEMPVLALGGEISFGERAVEAARRIAKDVRGGVVPRCGHWIAEERPEALVEALLGFFSEGASAPPPTP